MGAISPSASLRIGPSASLITGPSTSLRTGGVGLKLGLNGGNRQHGQDERSEKLGLIGFELGLFFFKIINFRPKMGEIGFVLHS